MRIAASVRRACEHLFVSETRNEIAQLAADGLTQLEIARRLGLAGPTVAYHLERIEQGPAKPPRRLDPVEQELARAGGDVKTRDMVALLLGLSWTRSDIARRLGVSKPTVAYHAKRLGAPMDARCARRYDWDEVQRYYDEGHTIAECAERFGFPKSTWHDAANRGAITPRPRKRPLDEILVANVYRNRYHLKRRLLAEGLKQAVCERCGLTEWLEEPVPLSLHHVNGDRYDNRLENLALLCGNCHALTDNFAGRNRHRATKLRMVPPVDDDAAA